MTSQLSTFWTLFNLQHAQHPLVVEIDWKWKKLTKTICGHSRCLSQNAYCLMYSHLFHFNLYWQLSNYLPPWPNQVTLLASQGVVQLVFCWQYGKFGDSRISLVIHIKQNLVTGWFVRFSKFTSFKSPIRSCSSLLGLWSFGHGVGSSLSASARSAQARHQVRGWQGMTCWNIACLYRLLKLW